ncbi:hypothetical protein AB6A40_006383 [Gnathostoma spinigerum]|uniref:Uncharacterized protein n=1 Tax=Gnathostoma spinigerum TaxID=75299 RepID=A0ABD6ENF2_9BILA
MDSMLAPMVAVDGFSCLESEKFSSFIKTSGRIEEGGLKSDRTKHRTDFMLLPEIMLFIQNDSSIQKVLYSEVAFAYRPNHMKSPLSHLDEHKILDLSAPPRKEYC